MNGTPFGFRIVGPCTGERRLIDWQTAFAAYASSDAKARCDSEAYLSAFTFGDDFRDHMRQHGTPKGFAGECGAAYLWFDIDRADDLEAARRDAVTLALTIGERFALGDDDLLIFFSGAKGFHFGLATSAWCPAPAKDFHRTTRRFCEDLATSAGVTIDTGVYDAVRAFRAPNSRHPKTGLHKRRVSMDELTHLSIAALIELAAKPEPFGPPTAATFNKALADDWASATATVRAQAEAYACRRDAGSATLNRQTLAFIREGAATGDRHRLTYSAARNLGEFGCPPLLARALLSDAALDSGLPPSEVKRQIDCGLKDAARKGGEA